MISVSLLKQYIKNKDKASLLELHMQFKEDKMIIYDMLQHLIRKGCICEAKLTPKCGSKCHQCDPLATITFTWI